MNRLEEMIDDSKPIMASIMVSSPQGKAADKRPDSSRAYDFGGLIRIEKDEISIHG